MKKSKNRKHLHPMKFIIATLLIIIAVNSSRAQDTKENRKFEIEFGIKAGGSVSSLRTGWDNIWNKSGKMGFNAGVFARIGNRLYIQPEINYAQFHNEYSAVPVPRDPEFQFLNVPLLGGLKIIQKMDFTIRMSGGPDFYYNHQGIAGPSGKGYKNYNIGQACDAGLDYGKFTFDARYSYGLSKISAASEQKLNIFSIDLGYKFK